MSSPTTTQQAWIIENRGKPQDVVKLHNDWPIPSELRKGEVLVKVEAAALNPIGYKLMKYLPNFLAKRPLPAEYDLAGTIEDSNDEALKKGDPVFGFIPSNLSQKTRQGALQQYARMPADHLVPRPSNVTPTEASGFSLTGETAYQALFHVGKLEAGQSVLINGGSSAVGAFAIQLAKANGAERVVATASGPKEEYVKGLGADEVVDYTKQPIHEYFVKNPPRTKFHIIFDAVGLTDPYLYTHSASYLAPGGTFITVGPSSFAVGGVLRTIAAVFRPAFLGGVKRSYRLVLVAHSQPDLKAIAELVQQGRVKPIVDSVYAWEDVHKAYERIMEGHAKGKIVIKVDPSVA